MITGHDRLVFCHGGNGANIASPDYHEINIIMSDSSLPLSPPPPPPPSPCSLDQAAWSPLPQTAPASSSLEVEGASTHSNYSQQQQYNSSLPKWMLRESNEKSDPALVYRLSKDSSTSIGDFQASEWTPPDSSYGAAIPIAGWIPKRIRRDIEWSVSVILITLCACLIITTSMRAERHKHNDSNAVHESNGLDLDDDRYMYYDDAFYTQHDDDDVYQDEEEEYEEDEDDNDDYMDEGDEDHDNEEDEDEDGEDEGERILFFDFF